MRNRSVALGQKSLLYTKAYRQIAGTVTATILFQRMEHWFDRQPEGFYKFMGPAPNNRFYREGDSWTEELEFSIDEFRSAFDAIGVRYASFKEFEAAPHKFKKQVKGVWVEMPYCSYIDRVDGLTFYLRNDEFVDRKLDEINSRPDGQRQSGQMDNGNVPHGQSQSGQMDNAHLLHVHDLNSSCSTHTQEEKPAAVCVKKEEKKSLSRHEWEMVYAWAKYRKSIGGKIEPLAVAKARFDDGLADSEIDEWLASQHETDSPPGTPESPELLPGESPPELLEQFMAAVAERVNPTSFVTWFQPIEAMSRGDTTVYFRVPEAKYRSWIGQYYPEIVIETLDAIGLVGYQFEFIVSQSREKAARN